jgi:hypothetical protein
MTNKVHVTVMPACPASFFKKDSRQAGMTTMRQLL